MTRILLHIVAYSIVFLSTACCLAGDISGAQDIMAKELEPVAKNIAEWLKLQGLADVRLEAFSCANSELDATNSNLVKIGLADSLREQKVTIKRTATATITGKVEYIFKKELPNFGAIAIKFTVGIAGGPEQVFPAFETRTDVIKAVLLGANWTSLGRQPGADDRSNQIGRDARLRIEDGKARKMGRDSTEPPPTLPKIQGSRVRVGDYEVELAVRPRGVGDYVPREAKFGDGVDVFAATPFVPISEGEEYEIRVHNLNPDDFDAAAEILVDGVNSLYFWCEQEGQKAFAPVPRTSHWLVPRNGTLQVAGWQRTDEDAERFVVGKFSASVAAELKLQNTDVAIGTVTVVLYRAWKKGEHGGLSATGRGDAYKNRVATEVREFGELRTVISIRYSHQEEKTGK